jgi:mannose-6-phosphate isomerase class I
MSNDKERRMSIDPFNGSLPQEAREFPRGLYNPFPLFPLAAQQIQEGYRSLAEEARRAMASGLRVLALDGYHGVEWKSIRERLEQALREAGVTPRWLSMAPAMVPPEVLRQRAAPFLGGNDRLFGFHYPLGLDTFFDPSVVGRLRVEASRSRGRAATEELLIIVGCGAALIEQFDCLWYVDIPKDTIQERAKQKALTNLGETEQAEFEPFYKRSYFFDWPAQSRHKRALLPRVDCFLDGSRADAPTWMTGDDLRSALLEVSESPFRVRPWFMPGPWGGTFMMGHMGLVKYRPNLAWSYELIAPENGITMGEGGRTLECTFDCLMYLQHKRVLGAAAHQFQYEWPIRLDYLDTVNGGNLSTQCHPRPDYIRTEFGETFTQDESYYISAAKPDARVYIGLTEECSPQEFERAVTQSEADGSLVDIDRFVHSEPSRPHDLFLIPNGTVHCSGKGNLVLEISATTYNFTFKIYDYLRRDLNGNFRPLNVRRAFDTVRFERRAGWVRENFLAQPRLLREGKDWKEYVLADRAETFYTTHRLDFQTEVHYECQDRAFAINLVEGERIDVVSENGRTAPLAFLESMLIPAATGRFTVRNKGSRPCKLIVVFVRPGTGIVEPLNA